MKKLLYIAIIGSMLVACGKDDEFDPGPSPYDGINPTDSGNNQTPLDPNTIQGLHQNIFQPKCATLGCHDGSFEPDYRTIQSTYSTLVYANVFKKVDDFIYRVVPGDTANSWLWNRVTTDDPVLGKMPLYSPALSQDELNNLSTWILNGAKDISGNPALKENNKPTLYGYAIFNSNTQFRYDTIREDGRNNRPMLVPANTDLDIWVGVWDDSTSIAELTLNQVKFSTSPDDFSNAHVANMVFNSTPFEVPKYSGNQTGIFFYKVTVNTGLWNVGDAIYMRLYTDDGDHETITEIPTNYHNSFWKLYYSIKIQ